MQIYMNRQVRTLTGEDFEPSTTLRAACFGACLNIVEDDRKASLEEKLKHHRLGKKIMSEGTDTGFVELSAEEVALLQRRVAATYPSNHFVGQICEMLEDKYTPPAPKTPEELHAEYHERVPPLKANGGIEA